MKKTLIAVAALSAMAASAMAANVTLYGKIDQGFQVQSKKVDGKDRDTTWKGVSGISSGSRWGLKGTEEIADGYKVGFVLESGFDGMDGTGSNAFNRDAFLTLDTPYGMLTVCHTGKLSDGNTGDIIAGKALRLARVTSLPLQRTPRSLALTPPALIVQFAMSLRSLQVSKFTLNTPT